MSKIDKIVKGFQERLKSVLKNTKHFDNYSLFVNSEEQSICVTFNALIVDAVQVDNRGYELKMQVGVYGYIPISQNEKGGQRERLFFTEVLNALTNWRYSTLIKKSDVDINEINLVSGVIGTTTTQGYRNGFEVLYEINFNNNDKF